MKRHFLSTLCLLAAALIFSAKGYADEVTEFTPDFTYGDFGCIITSEENAEVAIYYNNYGNEANYVDIDEIKERKLVFPTEVKWQNKTYIVTSLYPYKRYETITNIYGESECVEMWISGIIEVELPSMLRYMPDVNPLKYYKDLCRISIQEGNENFMVENGSLYSFDGTILYAVPSIPDDTSIYIANERIVKIHTDALYKTKIDKCDFSQLKNLEPTTTSFFENIFTSYWEGTLYYPPTIVFDVEAFINNPDISYYLPSSINDIKPGYIKDRYKYKDIYSQSCKIKTYFNVEENLVINNGFICIDKGKKLVAYNEYEVPYRRSSFDGPKCLAEKIPFPEGIEKIAATLFSCRIIPEMLACPYVLPSTLKCVEDYAFDGYEGIYQDLDGWGGHTLIPVTIDTGVIFSRDAEGNEIEDTLPEGLETMGKGCFMRSMLKEIIVPNVKHIPELAFAGCKQLEKITFGEGVEQIELSALFAGVPIPDTDEIRLTPETCVIECLSITPPQLLSTDFDATQTFNNTVIVPDEAIEAYKEAWGNNFPNIYTVSGINSISADDNSDNNSEEIYYNLNGQRVDGDRNSLAPGLYICRKANSTSKVIIR